MIAVSIIVVAHNDEADLPLYVGSALAQRGVTTEMLVVDNDSSDGSREAVRRVGGQRVRLLGLAENIGFAAALNLAIGACTARYVLALNPDCRLEPDFVAVLAGRLDRRADVGFASGRPLWAEGTGLSPRGRPRP